MKSADFLATWDKDLKTIKKIVSLAQKLRKNFYSHRKNKFDFSPGVAVSIFRDKSTRTKYSYAAAASLLNLSLMDFNEEASQVTHGESVAETVNMLSFTTRVLGIRDDIYLGLGHNYMKEASKALDWGFKNGVLGYRPSLINLQSDEDHPTQSLSDLAHLVNHFRGLKNLKGKNIVVSWAYSPSYGKPMSVPQGAIALLSRFGVNLTLAYPKGYNLISKIEDFAAKESKKSGGKFRIVHNMEDAFANADVVYPKSWASFEIMRDRTALLKKGEPRAYEKLEKKALSQNAKHISWTCTEKMMQKTKKGRALYMHCLPADVSVVTCGVGEVEASVFGRYKKELYEEASYKPFIIAAMIILGQLGVD